MRKTSRFVIWICSKFTREEIEEIIKGLLDVLANRNPDVKPKDDFKQKHPNYRNFFVDPNPPLKAPPKTTPKSDWRKLLSSYKNFYPVTRKRGVVLLSQSIPKTLKLRYLEALSAGFVVLPQSIFILTMAKGAHSLSAKSVLPYHRCILVIGVKLNIFALIVAIRFIFGKSEEMSLSINVTMISAHLF